jgi:hypothetical protein
MLVPTEPLGHVVLAGFAWLVLAPAIAIGVGFCAFIAAGWGMLRVARLVRRP